MLGPSICGPASPSRSTVCGVLGFDTGRGRFAALRALPSPRPASASTSYSCTCAPAAAHVTRAPLRPLPLPRLVALHTPSKDEYAGSARRPFRL